LTLDKQKLKDIKGLEEDLKSVMNVSKIKEGAFKVEFV